jgi:hypothetical protein
MAKGTDQSRLDHRAMSRNGNHLPPGKDYSHHRPPESGIAQIADKVWLLAYAAPVQPPGEADVRAESVVLGDQAPMRVQNCGHSGESPTEPASSPARRPVDGELRVVRERSGGSEVHRPCVVVVTRREPLAIIKHIRYAGCPSWFTFLARSQLSLPRLCPIRPCVPSRDLGAWSRSPDAHPGEGRAVAICVLA